MITRRSCAFLALLALLVAGSCSRIEETISRDELPGLNNMTVEATWGDYPETKTSLQSDGSILWSPGDKINLFYGSSSSSEFTATITEPSATASFTGYLQAATGSSGQGIATQTFWGVYPYDEGNTCDGSGVTLMIKGVQTASPGTFGEGMNPAVANSPGLSLSFKNVGSWFVFSVLEDGITSVKFSGNCGEDIAGRIRVTMNSSEDPVPEVVEGEGLKSIIVTPDVGNAFIPNTEYYITVIPQTLTNGFTFTMYKGSQVAIRYSSKPLSFNRSSHVRRTELDDGLPWEYDYVEMAEGFKWARRNVGAYSPEGYGDYFAWGETSQKSTYYQSNYDYSLPFSDAATANWGDGWRTPTAAEFDALLNTANYTWEETTENGVNGYRVTSKVPGYAGNSIFLPDAGYSLGTEAQACGYYWSSSSSATDSRKAKVLYFRYSSSSPQTTEDFRYWGNTIRAIYDPLTITHEYVDMGGGIMFATTNVGADSPEDFGDYFAWGETAPKSSYSQGNYNATEFQDAATANWGNGWRMPTRGDWTFLMTYCDWEWTAVNGVNGYKVTSSDNPGNSIFLPAAGRMEDSSLANQDYGYYWTNTKSDNTDAYNLWFKEGYPDANNMSEFYYGLPIRPVYGGGGSVPVTGVSFDMENYAVLNGGTSALTASVSPAEATNQELTWTSSDPTVAIVSPTGVVTGKKVGTTTITARTVDGGFTATCTVTVITNATYVDMGNGTRWATRNVGADSPEGHGGYYAWGETGTKSSYSWTNYQHGSSSSDLSKYNSTDGKTVLDPEDDAATANWGDAWRMPTDDEFMWLKDNCTWTWAEMNGVKGRIVMSNLTGYDSAIIFIPATGYYNGGSLKVSANGCYWSATLTGIGTSNAKYFALTATTYTHTNNQRSYGLAVRPVYDPQ